MFGEKALELIKELQRSEGQSLPPYNEHQIRLVLEEMRSLYEQNQKDATQALHGDKQSLYASVHLRHAALERNKRCLFAYVYNRKRTVENMRWEFGTVLPSEIRTNLSDYENEYFGQYNKLLANYMRSVGSTGLDLTQDMLPPKSLYIEVRCLQEYGQFECCDGRIVALRKNSQHLMLRSECESLIRQGVLEHV